MMMQPFYVVSPEYETYHGGGYDPPEYGRDCVTVEARTKREAVIRGVKKILSDDPDHSWAGANRQAGINPFSGYRAELARCGHGNPHFLMIGENVVPLRCWACDAAAPAWP